MRDLITVKLANEQVNYRSAFPYKNCHLSLSRRSSLLLSQPKEKEENGGKGGKEQRTDAFFSPVFFKKAPPFPSVAAQRLGGLRLRGNGCINELFLFFHRTPPPCILFLSPFTHTLRRPHQTPHSSFLPTLSFASFHPSLHRSLWEASDYLFILFASTTSRRNF